MAKIIIIEGSATAGKSTMQEQLGKILETQGKKVLSVDEKIITASFWKEKGVNRNVEGSIMHLKNVIN